MSVRKGHPLSRLALSLVLGSLAIVDGTTASSREREPATATNRALALAPADWASVGPTNVAGRVRTILINPSAVSEILIGSPGGGIFRTTDAGVTWAPLAGYTGDPAVTTLAAQPGNFNVIYAGTGEAFETARGLRGAGIFKTSDGGTTWTPLAATNDASFHYVNRIAISPDGNVILAATQAGLYRSADAGASFTQVLAGGLKGVLDVEFDPSNASLAVAGGYEGRAWHSTDGGLTFTPAAGLPIAADALHRVELAYAPSSPTIVYALTEDTSPSPPVETIYRSTDGGASFTARGTFTRPASALRAMALFVDPSNPNVLLSGDGDTLRRSTDGGMVNGIVNLPGWPEIGGVGYHAIVPVPGFDGTSIKGAYFANNFGLHATADIYTVGYPEGPNGTPSGGWVNASLSLPNAQFTSVAVRESSQHTIGGTESTHLLIRQALAGNTTWGKVTAGELAPFYAGVTAVDQDTGVNCYVAFSYLRLLRNPCSAASAAETISSGIGDAGSPNTANAIAPFILDPNDQRRLLAGGARLWRTANARDQYVIWSAIKPPADSPISAIAVQRHGPDQIWVGHNNGDIFTTSNGTAAEPSWTKVDVSVPDRLVTRMAVDPNDSRIAYAAFDGYSGDNIWKTIDGGGSWTNIHGSLPEAPIRSIVLHPGNSDWLYVGSEDGVFTSENGGATWSAANEGPANVAVTELVFAATRTIYAATNGRGVFKATLDEDPVPGAVRLISPASGYTGTLTPTYRWHANPLATWYQLEVSHGGGRRVRVWYTAAQAGCASGTGTCQVTPQAPSTLLQGQAWWRIQTYSGVGYGGWSQWLEFRAGAAAASVLETYQVPDTRPGFVAPLWVRVRNDGALPLPDGTQAWVRVTGPGGFDNFVAYGDASGIPAGQIRWVLANWDVPYGRAPGVHAYEGRVWSTSSNGWISTASTSRSFNILPSLTTAARVVATYRVDAAMPGAAARLWAQVRNVGTAPLTGRLHFNVYTVGWIGSTAVTSLQPGAQQWYSVDWAAPANRPPGDHWYFAQVWDTPGVATYSPASAWQLFTMGFNASFTGTVDGWSDVVGVWTANSNNYLYTTGHPGGGMASSQFGSTSYANLDVSVRIWRDGFNTTPWEHGLYVRGNPVPVPALFQGWQDGYQFAITRNGMFQVRKFVNGQRVPLSDTMASGAINQGSAWNVLRVTAIGSQLTFWINGTQVWTGTDSTFTSGRVGVFGMRSGVESAFALWVDYARLAAHGQ